MTIGEAIRKAREARGYSMQKLAERSGINIITIYNWEHERASPTAYSLICVADALEISLDELVGRNYVDNCKSERHR